MENNNLLEIVKQSFRTAVGATAYVVETLQDEQKRNELFSQLNSEWAEKSQQWQEKGELTEQEARRIIEQFFQQKASQQQSSSGYTDNGDNFTTYSGASHSQEIRELTQEIISLREELKKVDS